MMCKFVFAVLVCVVGFMRLILEQIKDPLVRRILAIPPYMPAGGQPSAQVAAVE